MLVSAIVPPWAQGVVALAVAVLACVVAIVFAALFAQKVSRWSLWKLAPSTLAVLAMLSCVTTDLAQKVGGDRGMENEKWRMENGELGGGTRSLPPELASASNLIAILNFAPDPLNKEVAFEVAYSNILFDYTASRDLYLFASTNLLEPRWMPIVAFAMPPDTNICAFAVTTNDVDATTLPVFLDTMNGIAFFRFAADIDSDGDGLIDSYEKLCSFTDPELADTDGDGLLDGQELFEEIGTDPLLPDTDGDGVSDGDEVVAGTSPLSSDTDGDGLSDAQELGAMTALVEEDFMWLDVVDATPLVEWEYAYGDNWVVPLIRDVVINGICYTNAKIHVDGTVQLLCPTNIWDWGYACNYGFLSNMQYAASHVTVAVCGARLYAQTNEWQSQIFHGTASRGGRDYTVVEYRNIGLAEHSDTNELVTCQLILPHDETNTLYVSYLCASNLFRETDLVVGVQCGWMRSWKPGERYYNLSWPLTVGFPQEGLTIKYSIGTGTAPSRPDTDFDGLLDAEEVLTAQTSPVVADMDGDGLFDGEEMALGTDPMNTDTDGDGMPDGWEVRNGLDPLADDAAGDLDGDGLDNLREYVLGTFPTSVDSDGDGISDRSEIGWRECAEPMATFDVSGGRNLLGDSQSYDGQTFVVQLPFTVRCGGYIHTNVTVCVDGVVALMSDREQFSFSVPYDNRDFAECQASSRHTAIAAYWDDLYFASNGGGQITVADVETNGLRYAVIEYANVRLYSQRYDASCAATFQIVIPEAETNTVYVHYISMSAAFDGSSATIGAQLPNREQTHQFSFDTAGAVTNGMVVAYHFGTGSNPTVADSDGDGLDDGFESMLGTSARYVDTDNDGLADKWENANGLNPLSAAGDDGADGDPDEDGLTNAAECAAGSNPNAADTDGDGLSDGAEVLIHGSAPLVGDTDGDGLPDGQESSIGTSPVNTDTDGDGLPDGWEVQNGLDPLSAVGDDGATGDPDGDGVDNFTELGTDSNPNAADTDGDGLPDGDEMSCVSFASPLPWLEISTLTNLTDAITNSYYNCVSIGLPSPVAIQGVAVTNITIDADGVVYFNREGYANPEYPYAACDFDLSTADANCFTVAPYWSYLFLSDESAPSSVRFGTAAVGTNGYYVLECLNLYQCLDSWATNAISFQMAFPTGRIDRVHVRYANLVGDEMDGRNASIGFQSFGARDSVSYCSWDRDMVHDGMGLSFILGYGSDPTNADTDGDGLSDGIETGTYGSDPCLGDTDGDGLSDVQEVALGTGLSNPDSDGDGLLDGWEVANEIDPLSSIGDDGASADLDGDGLTNLQEQTLGGNPRSSDTDGDGLSDALEIVNDTNIGKSDSDSDGLTDKQEVDLGFVPLDPDMDRDGMPDGWEVAHGLNPRTATGVNGANGDPDHDGLSNIDEYLNNTDPHSSDTDGDGVPDRIEVEREADPTDPSDGDQAPPVDKFREIEFNINGDCAAWEMTIEGLGPDDTRTRKMSMGRPNAASTTSFKMRKGNSYRLSMRWLNCDGFDGDMSPWYCWQALIDGLPRQKSFDDSYREGYCVRLPQSNNIVVGNGWIAENEDGLLTSHVHASRRNSYGGPGAGNVAQGLSATLYVLGDPKVIPDYDRNGRIDSSDEAIHDAGNTTFRFWVNNDNDSGNVNDSKNDRPGSGSNGQDDTVNGRSDLLDFTPVLLDVSDVFPPGTPDSVRERVSWKLQSSMANAVWTSLSASEAGNFLTTDCGAGFGPDLSQNAHEATVTKLIGGVRLPDGFAQRMKNAGGKGVVMIEGRASGSFLRLQGYIAESTTPEVEGALDVEISSVEDMYRWMCLRNVCGDRSGLGSRLGQPRNRPDAECDGRHFVFVHGYNVDVKSARGWASEMFKRLWQSGSQSMFTAVDWFGNDSQVWEGVPFIGGEALDYYINVRHALDTALNFSVAANALPGAKVMLAHSLGNMIVSEAAKYHLLDYQKYYMLNAAVPMEAYDADASAQEMIEHGWSDVDSSKWAANWYERIPYSGDPRQTLKWRGRFAGIHDAVNCYSPTEEVLANATMNGWGGLWGAQELFKGTATLHIIPGNCEGGWGYNSEHTNLAGLLTDFAKTNEFTDAELVASPIFRKFDNSMLHQTNLILIAQTELNKVMGDGIPATSFAAGRNLIVNVLDGNIELSPDRLSYWPSERIVQRRRQWYHSDICNVAFFYVNLMFHKIVAGENQ